MNEAVPSPVIDPSISENIPATSSSEVGDDVGEKLEVRAKDFQIPVVGLSV